MANPRKLTMAELIVERQGRDTVLERLQAENRALEVTLREAIMAKARARSEGWDAAARGAWVACQRVMNSGKVKGPAQALAALKVALEQELRTRVDNEPQGPGEGQVQSGADPAGG